MNSENTALSNREVTWSLLDPKPVVKYHTLVNDYVVYWQGFAMPHTFAMNMVLESAGAYPPRSVRSELNRTYEKFYFAGALADSVKTLPYPDSSICSYLAVKRQMNRHLRSLLEKSVTVKQLFSWLMP